MPRPRWSRSRSRSERAGEPADPFSGTAGPEATLQHGTAPDATGPDAPGPGGTAGPDAPGPGGTAGPDAPGPGGTAGPDAPGPGSTAGPDAAGPGRSGAGRQDVGPAGTGPDGGDRDSGSLGELVARVADPDDSTDRTAQLVTLARGIGAGARGAAGSGFRGVGGFLADVLADAAPRLRIRDAATLRLHHPGRTDAEIAEALTRTAARTTAAFGAAVGALAAVEFAAPPTLLAAPIQLAAETLAVAAVEVKLTAELHEISGRAVVGTGAQRGSAYLASWVRQRALDPQAGVAGLSAVLGAAAKRELRTMLTRRTARGVTKLAPFLAGAVAGGVVNRRATRALGDTLVAELRPRRW